MAAVPGRIRARLGDRASRHPDLGSEPGASTQCTIERGCRSVCRRVTHGTWDAVPVDRGAESGPAPHGRHLNRLVGRKHHAAMVTGPATVARCGGRDGACSGPSPPHLRAPTQPLRRPHRIRTCRFLNAGALVAAHSVRRVDAMTSRRRRDRQPMDLEPSSDSRMMSAWPAC